MLESSLWLLMHAFMLCLYWCSVVKCYSLIRQILEGRIVTLNLKSLDPGIAEETLIGAGISEYSIFSLVY